MYQRRQSSPREGFNDLKVRRQLLASVMQRDVPPTKLKEKIGLAHSGDLRRLAQSGFLGTNRPMARCSAISRAVNRPCRGLGSTTSIAKICRTGWVVTSLRLSFARDAASAAGLEIRQKCEALPNSDWRTSGVSDILAA
jgi:hypothetical protein